MIFSQNQIEYFLQIVNFHHVLFIAENVGTDVLTSEDKALLRKYGVDLNKYINDTNLLHQSFKFGVLAQALGNDVTKQMSYADFTRYLKSGKYISLNRTEKNALEIVKHQSYSDIKGLGNTVAEDLMSSHIESSQEQRRKFEKIIQKEAEQAIIDRSSIKDMVLNLGAKTQDWARDFGRISEYVMHTAYEEGKAEKLKSDYGEDVHVYKDVYEGACRHCIRNYLTNGLGSEPIIFRLEDLKTNGTNIGKKPADWGAVLGPMHPYCRCTINYVEEGSKWDERGKSFKEGEYVRKVQRKGKIIVTINGKRYEV